MNILTFIIGCGATAMALIMFRLAKKDKGNQKLAKGLTPSSIRDIQPGLCLVEGIVEKAPTCRSRTRSAGIELVIVMSPNNHFTLLRCESR